MYVGLDLQKMPRTLTKEWEQGVLMRRKLEREARQALSEGLPPTQCLTRLLTAAEKLEKDLAVIATPVVEKYRFSSREEACAVAAAAREHAEQKKALKSALRKNDDSDESDDDFSQGNCGNGKGKCQNDKQDSQATEPEVAKAYADLHAESFPLEVVIATSDKEKRIVLSDFSYRTSSGKLATGRDLREQIADEAGGDVRQMRLLAYIPKEEKEEESEPENENHFESALGPDQVVICVAGELRTLNKTPQPKAQKEKSSMFSASPICNSALLAFYQLDKAGVVVEVQKKQRGGRKKPGNGFHKRHRGKTYAMSIAGTIVHDTVFSQVKQYCTVVDDNNRLETLLGYMRLIGKDAVVLCAASTQCLRHQLLAHGAIPDGEVWLKVGAQRLALVAEVEMEAPSLADADIQDDVQDALHENIQDDSDSDSSIGNGKGKGMGKGKGQGKGQGKGKGKGNCQDGVTAEGNEQQIYTVEVPQVLLGTELIVVYDGAVQECASLSKLICSIRCPGKDLQVLHLASYERSIFVETRDECLEIAQQLGQDLRLCGDVEFHGQQRVPRAAMLVTTLSPSEAFAAMHDAELPAVFDFRLRQAALGLVIRLRQRFECCIPEVFYDPLCAILKAPTWKVQGN